jgi:integrase
VRSRLGDFRPRACLGPHLGAPQSSLDALDADVARTMVSSIALSAKQYASRISAWLLFCRFTRACPLPACPRTVLRFASTWSNGRSCTTYISAIRYLHHRFLVPTLSWDTASLALFLRGRMKDTAPPSRAIALSYEYCEAMAGIALQRREADEHLLISWSFAFGFRVQSEAIPLEFDSLAWGGHSSIEVTRSHSGHPALRISLRRRKNMPRGAVLIRPCICARSQLLCPVHTFERWLKSKRFQGRPSGPLFPGLSASSLQRRMQELARRAGHPSWSAIRLHGFRRGMAQDILKRGGSLSEVLRSGGWRSAAFLAYLDKDDLEQEVILDFLCDDDASAIEAAHGAIPEEVRALVIPPEDTIPEDFRVDLQDELAAALDAEDVASSAALVQPPRAGRIPAPVVPAEVQSWLNSPLGLGLSPAPRPMFRPCTSPASSLAVSHPFRAAPTHNVPVLVSGLKRPRATPGPRKARATGAPPREVKPTKHKKAKPPSASKLNPTMVDFLRVSTRAADGQFPALPEPAVETSLSRPLPS